ncbi:MAG: acyl-CoA thioesterase [Candidatus Omnitrophica bacterium]|nr:acyl-CoA thioesterase [Candidatus Omnitrophota bacterium]
MMESKIKISVRYQETDRMGVAYHSNYLIWFEAGRTEFFKMLGVSYPELEKQGYFLVVTDAQLSYKSPVTYEDSVEIVARLKEMESCSMVFEYDVKKSDLLVAHGTTRHAFVNAKGKVVKIPSAIIEAVSAACPGSD